MSETRPEPEVVRDSPGIADILARREGDLPPSMLPDDAPPEREREGQDETEALADRYKRDADDLRNRATQAEAQAAAERQRATRIDAELQRTRQSAQEAEFSSVTTALADREAEQERLQGEIAKAGEDGDYARIGKISSRLGELGAEVAQLRAGKQAFEADRGTRLRQPEPRSDAQPADYAPTIQGSRAEFLAGRTPATQEWLRKNDRFFTDPSFFQMVTGADAIARGRGFAADTPEYFRFVEEQAMPPAPRQPSRGSGAPPAAPPSREAVGPSGRPGRAGDIYVTPEQKRIAEWMKVDPVEYAQQDRELRDRGEIPHKRR